MDILTLIMKAEKLIECVEFDVNGSAGRGGNGGLTSNDTIRASGALRAEIHRWRQRPVDDLPRDSTKGPDK